MNTFLFLFISKLEFDIVSRVFPDFEIIILQAFLFFSFLLKIGFKLLIKINFFFVLFCKNW